MISTPFVAVPPPRYGGTELVVAELVEGLLGAGHEVTLFATGDSTSTAECRALYDRAEWPPHPTVELDHAAWAVAEILGDARDFDVVHAHLPAALAFSRFLDVPMVYTIHHDRDEKLARVYARHAASYIAISERQRELMPEARGAVVIRHGLSPAAHPLGRGDGGYAAFLGRFEPPKGAHVAIDVARAAGVPMLLAGRAPFCEVDYYQREVAARLARPGADCIGEVGGPGKMRFLGGAMALLFPVAWEEPFGLVMIEAMLCGTPVLALRRGSVPEVVEEGVTGFICDNQEEMALRLRQIAAEGFDRGRCRARAVERWSAGRMVREHLALYQQLAWERGDGRAAAPRI